MPELPTDVEKAKGLVEAGLKTPTADLMNALFTLDKKGKQMIDRLRGKREFVLARDVLKVAHGRKDATPEKAELVRQQFALCLYKDPDLPAKGRLDEALVILSGEKGLSLNEDPETLGIAGAIHRRHWDLDGHRSHLERALSFYRRGHDLFLENKDALRKDKGYTGINAAFLLNQLAFLSMASNAESKATRETGKRYREEAHEIRGQIIDRLPGLMEENALLRNDWWVAATLIEAYFGHREFEEATKVFEDWKKEKGTVAQWQIESTLKQLVALARLLGYLDKKCDQELRERARACLDVVLEGRSTEILKTADQKLGLALSGGGFRASFYEIGVLAALAEFDLLRHVEVLSCVSGGSVLGAYYYLEVRRLLQENEDGKIDRDDYIKIVKRMSKHFFVGVEKNIRTRVVLNPFRTLHMFFSKKDSRTIKAGELYEEHLYRKVDEKSVEPLLMRNLLIEPLVNGKKDDNFKPKSDNWQRRAKAPILVLNATSLNTGHNWQFTARWMGEPLVEVDIDSNPRLRRMNYDSLEGTKAKDHANLRLGHAVAASACVPGLFEPLALNGLYENTVGPEPGRTTVRLVDGGVHDNQGVESLIEQDCNVLIVADASGQMPYERQPSSGVLGTVSRSNSTMMARIREAQYKDVKVQRDVGRRKGLAFVHLKQDLYAEPVNWIGCAPNNQKDGTEDPRVQSISEKKTDYGIRKTVQQKLASIRTDLDSFSEIEAFALMYSGYRATREEIPKAIDSLPRDERVDDGWNFLAVEPYLVDEVAKTKEEERIEEHLDVGRESAFKVWRLDFFLKYLRWIILVAGGGSLLWYTFGKNWIVLGSDAIWWFVVGTISTALVGWKFIHPRDLFIKILTAIGLSLVGSIAAFIHIESFDKLFKKIGRCPGRRQDNT